PLYYGRHLRRDSISWLPATLSALFPVHLGPHLGPTGFLGDFWTWPPLRGRRRSRGKRTCWIPFGPAVFVDRKSSPTYALTRVVRREQVAAVASSQRLERVEN